MNWRFAGSLDRGSRRGWCLGVGGWVGGFALPFVVSGVVAVAVVAVVVVDFDDRWQVQLLQGLRKKGIFSSPPNRSLTRRCALCGPCHSLVPPCDSGPLIGPLRRPLGSCASSRAPLCVSHKSCWSCRDVLPPSSSCPIFRQPSSPFLLGSENHHRTAQHHRGFLARTSVKIIVICPQPTKTRPSPSSTLIAFSPKPIKHHRTATDQKKSSCCCCRRLMVGRKRGSEQGNKPCL